MAATRGLPDAGDGRARCICLRTPDVFQLLTNVPLLARKQKASIVGLKIRQEWA
jgi:hypothetical protein